MERIILNIGDGITDHNITVSSVNTTSLSNEEMKDYGLKNKLQSYINPQLNLEKEIYTPEEGYTINFSFFNSSYSTDFTSKFFTNKDLKRNVYKKSGFMLEYLTSDDLEKADRYNSNLLSTVYDIKNNRGISVENNAVYNVDSESRESYNFYYYRNVVSPYISLYVRAYFLNAKDGEIYNFVTSNDITIDNLKDSSYLYELRIYPNKKYQYYKNNVLVTNLNFYELNI